MQQTSKICHTRRILPQTLGRLSNGFVAPQVRVGDARQRSENGDEHQREETARFICSPSLLSPLTMTETCQRDAETRDEKIFIFLLWKLGAARFLRCRCRLSSPQR